MRPWFIYMRIIALFIIVSPSIIVCGMLNRVTSPFLRTITTTRPPSYRLMGSVSAPTCRMTTPFQLRSLSSSPYRSDSRDYSSGKTYTANKFGRVPDIRISELASTKSQKSGGWLWALLFGGAANQQDEEKKEQEYASIEQEKNDLNQLTQAIRDQAREQMVLLRQSPKSLSGIEFDERRRAYAIMSDFSWVVQEVLGGYLGYTVPSDTRIKTVVDGYGDRAKEFPLVLPEQGVDKLSLSDFAELLMRRYKHLRYNLQSYYEKHHATAANDSDKERIKKVKSLITELDRTFIVKNGQPASIRGLIVRKKESLD